MKPKGKIVNGLCHPSREMAYAKTGFTIIELLTVMSIIIIILSILLPALNMAKWYAKYVTQKNQLHNIDQGLQGFEIDFKEYPDSSSAGADGQPYCGAMKLAEAMAGQDGLGFNPDSKFTADDGSGPAQLYPRPAPALPSLPDWYVENLRNRREFLEAKDVQICSLDNLYTSSGWANSSKVALLCDVYRSVTNLNTHKKMGMPILYYKADTSKLLHDVNNPDNAGNIYNYKDNQEFLNLGLPPDKTATKPQLYQNNGRVFYEKTLDKSALPIQRPYNKDSYILISAGGDGIYGTGGNLKTKDVFNFAD